MFKEINYTDLDQNIFKMIGTDYLLISANDLKENNNIMTASWGMAGILWNFPVLQIFVRPQRHTHIFLENGNKFAICVFPEELKKRIHSICGSKSGRDTDKIKETGLTPVKENGYTYFKEANIVIFCETIYKDNINPNGILQNNIHNNYNNDYHTAYIGKITKILTK